MRALDPWAGYTPEVGDQIGVSYLYRGDVRDVVTILDAFKRQLDMRPGIQVREVRRVSNEVVYATVLVCDKRGTLGMQLGAGIYYEGHFQVQAAILLDERLTSIRREAICWADDALESVTQSADRTLGNVASSLPEPSTTISMTLLAVGAMAYYFLILSTRG